MTVIYQVTDTHIPVFGNLGVRENFLALMEHTRKAAPDLLAITGDLPGEDGSRAAYEWMRSVIPDEIPCIVIPGNHDDTDVLFDVFGGGLNQNSAFFEKIRLEEIDLLFANTASTWLPDDQLEALTDKDIRPGSILFLHHPTRKIADGSMDRVYPLQNREEVDAALLSSQLRHVFCGHFHTEFTIEGDYDLHVTPSPAFDVSLESVEPLIAPPRIPLREIVVEGATVTTRVIYLDE